MKITLIAAIGKNREIGEGNALLWDLPADMKHFRSRTKGKTVIMGRKTFESIGRPLPNRENIVLSRDNHFSVQGAKVICDLEKMLDVLRAKNVLEVMIIGGEMIYRLALPFATHLSITFVDAEFPNADSFFPKFEKRTQKILASTYLPKNAENKYSCIVREIELG